MKLISLNIEGNRHWDRIIPFLKEEDPDVFCVQEIFEHDMKLVPDTTNMSHAHFVPMALYPIDDTHIGPKGIAIFTKNKNALLDHTYYKLPSDPLRLTGPATNAAQAATQGYAIAWATIEQDGEQFTIGTTHLTVTEKGMADEFQTADAESLLELSKAAPPHVLCGDFNMPRSINTLYNRFTQFYTDTIPLSIEGSLDPVLHRANKDPVERERIKSFMVDYLFTTPEYVADNVHMHTNVSDHAAIIADLRKTV